MSIVRLSLACWTAPTISAAWAVAWPMLNKPAPAAAKPAEPAKPPEKRLTRLEKLRLEQEEREKANGTKK